MRRRIMPRSVTQRELVHHTQRIKEHHGIHRLERPALPRRHLRHDGIRDTVLIRSGGTSIPYMPARNA